MRIRITDNSAPTLEEYKRLVGAVRRGLSVAVAREAMLLSNTMKLGLRDQKPGGKKILPISRTTILLRGIRTKKKGKPGTKALIDSASMINSAVARKKSQFHYTAGVHRNARGKGGKKLANIAAIHENGTKTYTVTVTEKMRRFSFVLVKFKILHAPWKVGQKLKRRIPARPWLNPAHEQWEKGADDRFARRLAEIMGMTAG